MGSVPVTDLSECEREPIHAPGAVQSHGAFLAADVRHRVITHASANLCTIFGREAAAVLGQPLESVIGSPAFASLVEPVNLPFPEMGSVLAPNGSELHLHAFHASGLLCIDIEPMGEERRLAILRLHAVSEALNNATSSHELCDIAVRGLRDLTGYDRVLAYRFAGDGHGEVIAEARAPESEPYLGLHYPASDMPPQARVLYAAKTVGVIADTEAPPVAILADPAWANRLPLDLTLSDLRSISPRHLQYMRNMNVAAAMRIGLTHGTHLWGMFVCHHGSPFLPDRESRACAELIGQIASLRLRMQAEVDIQNQRSARTALLAALVERFAEPEPLTSLLVEVQKPLLDLVDAAGALVQYHGDVLLLGQTPPLPAAKRVLARLQRSAQGEVVAVTDLALHHPDLEDCAAAGSGALLLRLAPNTADAIVWFRPEQSRAVLWGGNPAEHAILDEATGQISPRRSFAAWRETMRFRSVPWTPADILLVGELRGAFAVAIAQRAQTELVRLRDYDPITGLPTWDLLQQWIREPGRYDNDRVSLLMIELPDFKDLSGILGKDGIKTLLIELARRLMRFAGPDTLVGRYGDAEFLFLQLVLAEPGIEARAVGIREALEVPYTIMDEPFRITPAFRFGSSDGADCADLSAAADRAMASAKAAGALQRKVDSQRQKMESLGRMIGGIAHEINNMLQPVTLLGQDMLDHDHVKPQSRETLGIMLDCTRQAREIIGDVLAFSRPKGRIVELLDPVELLHDTLRLVRQAVPPGIILVTEIQPHIPKICVNRTTFAQVLLNLATNAAAAMDGEGSLTVTLSATADTTSEIGIITGRCLVRMCVLDTGCGMDKETLDRAFEPFFTTKKIGQGSGLGLPVVFGLVEEMAGTITLASEVGVGTTVIVLIPCALQMGQCELVS